jgi:hypothetical protein
MQTVAEVSFASDLPPGYEEGLPAQVDLYLLIEQLNEICVEWSLHHFRSPASQPTGACGWWVEAKDGEDVPIFSSTQPWYNTARAALQAAVLHLDPPEGKL